MLMLNMLNLLAAYICFGMNRKIKHEYYPLLCLCHPFCLSTLGTCENAGKSADLPQALPGQLCWVTLSLPDSLSDRATELVRSRACIQEPASLQHCPRMRVLEANKWLPILAAALRAVALRA